MAIATVWSDVHHSLTIGGDGDIRMAKDLEAVVTSLYNIILTRKGERLMWPEFGSEFEDLVFELIDPALFESALEQLKRDIELWEDRARLISGTVTGRPDHNEMALHLGFRIRGYSNVFTLTMPLTNQGGALS